MIQRCFFNNLIQIYQINRRCYGKAYRHRSSLINFSNVGAWNHRLELPMSLNDSIESGTVVPQLSIDRVGAASLLGRRIENEDRYHLQTIQEDILMVSVFDGHGGSHAANFAWQHMSECIVSRLDQSDYHKESDPKKSTLLLEKALCQAFIQLNDNFIKYTVQNFKDSKCQFSGTTATVCLLHKNRHLILAHVGDSHAILCRNAKAIRLTGQHDLDNPVEKRRVLDAGGRCVPNTDSAEVGPPRVNARLNMTRSIGDLDLKSFGVISTPTTTVYRIKPSKDAFVVLTTDGVSFSLTDQEIVDIINSRCDPEQAANQVADQALQFGSQDNCTAVIMPFGAWGKHEESVNVIQYSFGRNIVGPRYS